MQISIKSNTYIYLAVLLFFIPVKWMISWVIAIVFHELCHLLAVKISGGEIIGLTIGLGGAEIQCGNMTQKSRMFSVLLGPIGGLALSLFDRWIPKIAICSLFLSVYNLIPILPLDGGRALHILFGEKRWFYNFQKILLIFILFLSLYIAFFMKIGLLPIVIVVILYWKYRKIPCKQGCCIVQ